MTRARRVRAARAPRSRRLVARFRRVAVRSRRDCAATAPRARQTLNSLNVRRPWTPAHRAIGAAA
jgi:hypothetical protein